MNVERDKKSRTSCRFMDLKVGGKPASELKGEVTVVGKIRLLPSIEVTLGGSVRRARGGTELEVALLGVIQRNITKLDRN